MSLKSRRVNRKQASQRDAGNSEETCEAGASVGSSQINEKQLTQREAGESVGSRHVSWSQASQWKVVNLAGNWRVGRKQSSKWKVLTLGEIAKSI